MSTETQLCATSFFHVAESVLNISCRRLRHIEKMVGWGHSMGTAIATIAGEVATI